MSILKVENLCKSYDTFKLDNVTFNLDEGKITGFIGKNGAGKTTTLKSIFNFIHKDGGKVEFFDKDFSENEMAIKEQVGFVNGGVDYYKGKKLKLITSVTKAFYKDWNDAEYKKYVKLFELDENKTPSKLSQGMKIKYSLVLALSHNAKLLILDEPTSGLDPVSRDELLDIFLDLADKGITIFFSTHIITDLEKCADNIIYIKSGKIIADEKLKDFESKYGLIEFENNEIPDNIKEKLIGLKREKVGYSAIALKEEINGMNLNYKNADLESVMIHIEKGEE